MTFFYKLYNAAVKNNADIAKGKYRYEHDGYVATHLNDKIKEHKSNFSFDFCSAIFKMSLIKDNNISFPENLSDMEDPCFTFLAAVNANKIALVDDAYLNVVKRPLSLTYGIPNYDKIKNKFIGLNYFLDIVNQYAEKINFDSYVFTTAFWISNCFMISARSNDILCSNLTANETLKVMKKVKASYYYQFKQEFENFGVNFEKYLLQHDFMNVNKEYNELNNEKYISESIPVFLSSDETYAPFVATTIASICYNTQSHIDFYILDGGISLFTRKQIETLKTKFSNFSVEFIEINTAEIFKSIDYKNACSHVSISTYNRFLIPKIKPDIKKAIYLDVDLIVLGDIKELYDIELGEHSLAAVPENISPIVLACTCTRLKLNKSHKYFNAGVLLLDCVKLRNQNILEKLLKTENESRDICLQADQDVLNIVFDGNYLPLPVKFNYMTNDIMRELSELKDIVVRHFNCKEKPWLYDKFEDKDILHFNDFWFFANLTPFYSGLKQKFNANMLENIENNIIRYIKYTKDNSHPDVQPLQNGLLQALRLRVQKDNEKNIKG